MKLRLRDDSLRLRLMQSEVDALNADGLVESRTRLPGGELVYALRADAAAEFVAARLEDGRITVSIPADIARDWAMTDVVSVQGEQPLDRGAVLHILVEKDFRCLVPREGENESDMYPHPRTRGEGR